MPSHSINYEGVLGFGAVLKIDLGHKINLQRVLCVTIILSVKTFLGHLCVQHSSGIHGSTEKGITWCLSSRSS